MLGIRRRKKKKLPKKGKERCWLVTVGGYDTMYSPPHTALSVAIKLPKKETPLDWFALKPKCYHRFEFTAEVLFGFWELTPEQFANFYRQQTSLNNMRDDGKGGCNA